MSSRLLLAIALLLTLVAASSCSRQPNAELATEFRAALTTGMMEKWFPAIVDTEAGGYLSNLSADWSVGETQDKMIVTQARHLWSASQMALFAPEDTRYEAATETGYRFLRDKMWDEEFGGFYNDVSREGTPLSGDKRAYGNAFAIFALASYYELTHSNEALELAKKTFHWLEAHSHDPENGGYFPFLTREGEVVTEAPGPDEGLRQSQYPYKDQNPTIHLLEAFTDLYKVWPDLLLEERLREQLEIVRDVIVDPEGFMRLYFTPEWEPVSFRNSDPKTREANFHLDHLSFGHDVETAYLMLEACEALGEASCEKTLAVGKRMLDYSLKWGFDKEYGGFYDRGYDFPGELFPSIIDDRKTWWAQAEGLHTLLLFSIRFPEARQYRTAFELQWWYIQNYLIDHERGGWFRDGLDTEPEAFDSYKASIWKGSYHNGRALIRCIRLLEENSDL